MELQPLSPNIILSPSEFLIAKTINYQYTNCNKINKSKKKKLLQSFSYIFAPFFASIRFLRHFRVQNNHSHFVTFPQISSHDVAQEFFVW